MPGPAPFFRRSLLPALCTLLLAAACDPGARDDAAPPAAGAPPAEAAAPDAPLHACALLPPSEVEAVLGAPARDSLALDMPAEGGGLTQCNYAVGDDPAAVSLMLRVSPEGTSPGNAPASVRASIEEAGVSVEDVPDLGEQAFWGGNQLHVFRGRWHLVVSPARAGGLSQARSLAERALAALPSP